MTCPVCSSPHVRGIDYLLESGHSLQAVSNFYEIPVQDLRHHQVKCLASLGGIDG